MCIFQKMTLRIDKPDTMQNELVNIEADGLEPYQNYTFQLILKHNYGTHKSTATFRSNSVGQIELKYAEPLRGSYYGADPMGLFLGMTPCEDFAYGGYLRCTPPLPFFYKLQLFDSRDKLLDQIYIKKHWMHPRLERTELQDDGFCATLFKPPGAGPFPAVIDISGTGGGIHEHKGAMLASEGFVVLCVAFFQYKYLPNKMEDVDLEYFIKPIEFLCNLPYTHNVIGIQGVSFGATIVDLLATRHGDKIKAVVSINGPQIVSDYIYMKEHGEPMPHLSHGQVTLEHCRFINGVMCSNRNFQVMTEQLTPETEIPWHRIPTDVKIRVIGSVDDLCQPSVHATLYRQRRLKETGHEVEVEMVNGGHIMEPPYFPHHELVYAKYQGFYCGYGGEVVLHAKSQEKTWTNTINFFHRALGSTQKIEDWNRVAHIVPPLESKL
uniref:BAAT/Acyl-CoA thioester hydrolase C-terminal domain-containing protein n=3 Tax=Caenorhabditis japonica TaxID=281687 RepID=A0A8R1I2M6_CAEJA